MSILKKAVNATKKVVNTVKKHANKVCTVVGAYVGAKLVAGSYVMAAEEITLPEIPIDFSSLATSGLATVSTVLVAIASVVVVVKLCTMGIRKISNAFNGWA
jgi:hypothetical protein